MLNLDELVLIVRQTMVLTNVETNLHAGRYLPHWQCCPHWQHSKWLIGGFSHLGDCGAHRLPLCSSISQLLETACFHQLVDHFNGWVSLVLQKHMECSSEETTVKVWMNVIGFFWWVLAVIVQQWAIWKDSILSIRAYIRACISLKFRTDAAMRW